MERFNFTLHPQHWVFESDAGQVFRALELADSTYLVSWRNKDGSMSELIFPRQDVLHAVAEKHWIVLEEEINI
jgi:hypothetical protein